MRDEDWEMFWPAILRLPLLKPPVECAIEGCHREKRAKRLCLDHYRMARATFDEEWHANKTKKRRAQARYRRAMAARGVARPEAGAATGDAGSQSGQPEATPADVESWEDYADSDSALAWYNQDPADLIERWARR